MDRKLTPKHANRGMRVSPCETNNVARGASRRGACVFALAALLTMGAAPDDSQRPPRFYTEQVRPFLKSHCLDCHSGAKAKGKLRLDELPPEFSDDHARRLWRGVLDRVSNGEMPPDGKPRPPEADKAAVLDWLRKNMRAAEIAQRAARGRVVLRRLNRVEYENTLSDLLGVNLDIKDKLPEDGADNGFDNAAATLHTSSFLMERYLETADTALDLAIANLPRPALFKKRLDLRQERHVRVTKEDVFRHLDDALVFFCSSAWQSVMAAQFYPQDGGLYRFRISANAYQSDGQPVTYRVVAGRTRLRGKDGLVGYFDAPARRTAGHRVRALHGTADDDLDFALRPHLGAGGQEDWRREMGGARTGSAMGRG